MANKRFFDAVRASLFSGKLSQKQVDGLNIIIGTFYAGDSESGLLPHADAGQLAYILATAYHETGGRMEAVRETFATSDDKAIRALDKAFQLGQLTWVKTPYWRDGWFGRGLVQLTHKENYVKLSARISVDLVGRPGLALDLRIAAVILIVGMTEGLFTGRPLKAYVSGIDRDFVGARRVVNGADRAQAIAKYAQHFLAALNASGPWELTGYPSAPKQPAPAIFADTFDHDAAAQFEKKPGLLARIAAFIKGLFCDQDRTH